MHTKLVAIALATFLSALLIGSSCVVAQDAYPARAVRIVISMPPGSAPDIRARVIANQLTMLWNRQVVVENRPGAGGALGAQTALSAAPDGYTLLWTVASVFTILPAQRDKLAFDPNRDFLPIALTASEGMVFAVSPKLGVNTLADFLALARKQPHKMVIGTNPAGSLPHLAAHLLVSLTKAPVTIVPYSKGGSSEAIREILGGRAHAVIEGRPGLQAHFDSGDLRPLAIMTRERVSVVPNLPTAEETVPGLVAIGWNGIFAPKGTPDGIVRQLSASLRHAIEAPEVMARHAQSGNYRVLLTDDFARFIEGEQKLWWPVVKEAGAY
jgi:tripartite-type tricarboxylate transporter receptor subunit TctC